MHLFKTECQDAAEGKKVGKLRKRKPLFQGNIFKMRTPVWFGEPSKTLVLGVWLTD